ncbi:unnamed protein product [Arctogadus glacialis]
MERGTFLGWRRPLLDFTGLLLVLSCCSGLDVSISQSQYEVARGGNIAMTCSYRPARPDSNVFLVKWEVQPDKENEPWRPVATWFPNNQIDIAPNFEGRAQMSVDLASRQSTLQLDKVLMQDSRTFQCSVTIQGDDEGKTAATTALLVLVAPSRPVCGIQGTAEYWNNISLSCMSEEGSPSPTYKWKSYSVLNAPRPFPLRATEKDGVLALFNISKEVSGFFVCTATNRVGHDSCNLTLSVLPTTMKVGATAGIIGGVVAGLVVLGIVIYCCCCKKDKENKPVEGSPGDVEFQDQPSVRNQYWDDQSSTLTKPYVEESDHFEEKSVRDLGNHNDNRAGTSVLEAEQHSYNDTENGYGNGSEGIRGRLDEKRDFSRGSRDRLDDQDEIRGSRDRLDDRNEIRGSRDRLDDQDEIRGSRDRLDDHPNRYRGSSDRLDDQHDRYRGSRDRLDDQHDDIRGSRDGLDDKRDRYRGSRDRLDDQSDEVRGSRDNLDNTRDRYGSRDRLDDNRDRRHGSRDNLDAQYNLHGGSRDRLGESRPSYNV